MDFIACPHCGKRISGACPGCARTLEPGWQFCPYCARTTEAPGSDRMRLPGKQRELPSFVAEFKTGVSG